MEKELGKRFGWKNPKTDNGLLIAELVAINFKDVPDPEKTAKQIVNRTIEKLPPEIIAQGEEHIKVYFNLVLHYINKRQLMFEATQEIKKENNLE